MNLPEHDEMIARLQSVAAREGLKVRDVEAVAEAAAQSGLSAFTISIIPDDQIADRLHILASKRRELFEAPASPTGLEPSFARFLGGLASDYADGTLSATKRLDLRRTFEAQQGQANAADLLRRNLAIKHGADEARWPLQAKAQLADLTTGRPKPPSVAPSDAQRAALSKLVGQSKLDGMRAIGEAAELTRKIAARVPGMDFAQTRLNALRARFPFVG